MGALKERIDKIIHNYECRTIVTACVSFAVTIGFVLFEGTFAILSRSIWYATLAIYHATLGFLRGGLLLSARYGAKKGESAEKPERRAARSHVVSGVFLVALTFALSGIIVLVVTQDYSFEYAGVMIYAAAFYAFAKIILAIINFVKAGRNCNLTMQAIRNVNVADALVSILALQVAMLQTFTESGSELNPSVFNAVTGGVVGVLVIALGSYMIIRGVRGFTRDENN